MTKVIIDGVEYIPAKDVVANEKSVARALLMDFWGSCNDDDLERFMNDPDIRVLVNDWGEGETLRAVLDEVTRQTDTPTGT